MYRGKRIGAILLMGGKGLRFGSAVPKQFLELDGKPVFHYALETLLEMNVFEEILLVCPPEWLGSVESEGIIRAVEGGETRQESSYRGLQRFAQRPDIVLIHDAVRPFVSEEIVLANLEAAISFGAADTCIPSADTLVHAPNGLEIASIPKRAEYLRGQTPQTFRVDWILEAHEKAILEGVQNASDDCHLVLRLGKPVRVVLGHETNLKITSEFDFLLAKQIKQLPFT